MTLELKNVSKRVGADMHIHDTSLVFNDNSFNILLGATRAGKTTLMQLMAGIQKPTTGAIWHRGKDVTHVPVQRRNVSMVYQQFINYPMLSVFENIASPLRVTGMAESEVKSRVGKAAEILRLTPMLDRKPAELSGGQQQRTAIARAIVKDSDLIFLDEPLANLDYKLREELRDELPKLFSGRNAIVFYATTEPHEALLFGNQTLTMHEGRITQFGPTAEIYRKPNSLVSARVFSDPPINITRVTKKGKKLQLSHGDVSWPVAAGAATASRRRLQHRPAAPLRAAAEVVGNQWRPFRPGAGDRNFGFGERGAYRCGRPDLGVPIPWRASPPGRRNGDIPCRCLPRPVL